MNPYFFVVFIPLLPLICFFILGLFGGKYIKTVSGAIGVVVLFISTLLSLYTAHRYFFVDGKINGAYHHIVALKYTWLRFSPQMSIDMGILLDPISVMMILIVSFISLMVHIFSLGYMKGEKRFATYYAFLSLFTFSMLGLVLSSNLFQIYIFWELVGISSFLLIGFYFEKPSAVRAANKAFIVTRFADFGFLIGILMLAYYGGTLDFELLIGKLTSVTASQPPEIYSVGLFGISMLTWGLLLVFIGGAGKSAMFPLHIWLPDAMEGPTPVSALIHAATMVVAGVFLIARLFPVFIIDITVLQIVKWVGIFSALFAAVIACTQTDIKRILAFSTMSQIGLMMFSLGISEYSGESGIGYTGSMFHLFTHAFFKSLLFLGTGAVIHFAHSNDIKDLGGLRKHLPVTHISFLIACLAIAGIPPFSGFFSKEEILTAAFHKDKFMYALAVLASTLTAFYIFRLYYSVFWRRDFPVNDSKHAEDKWSMKIPLMMLAICAAFAGFVPFASWITSDGVPLESHIDLGFSAFPVLMAVTGIGLATYLYKTENSRPLQISSALGNLYKATYRKFYIDELYLFVTRKIIFNGIGKPAAWFDKNIVDGFMNALAISTAKISGLIKGLQSGKVQNYALYFFGGVIALAVLFIYILNT
jgi:NADH-quinone oxidoreductase subunit L